jgi:hypothetical protein
MEQPERQVRQPERVQEPVLALQQQQVRGQEQQQELQPP